MNIAEDLIHYLGQQPRIRQAVGQRIIQFDGALANTHFPRLVIGLVSNTGRNSLGGRGSVEDQRWQIDCQARSASEARVLADAVQDALDGYLGPLGQVPEVAVELINEFDEYDEGDGGKRAFGVHRVIQDYQLLAERSP